MKKADFCFLIFLLLAAVGCQHFSWDRKEVETGQYYKTQWQLSQELLKERNAQQAEPILKEIYNANLSQDPSLSTQALFQLGLINEGRGQWDLALAQFKECEAKREHLPLLQGELELPARLSGLYAALGEIKISDFYTQKTESALQTYASQIRLDQESSWWAETFYNMGYFPISEMNEENWVFFATRFESTVQYLIRSMELSDVVWSQRSYDLTTQFFKKSLQQLNVNHPQTEENWVVKNQQIQDRINLLGGIIEKMKLWRPLELRKSQHIWSLYESLDISEKELQNHFVRFKPYTPPSDESLRRNALKREGLMLKPVTPDIDNRKNDPNL